MDQTDIVMDQLDISMDQSDIIIEQSDIAIPTMLILCVENVVAFLNVLM